MNVRVCPPSTGVFWPKWAVCCLLLGCTLFAKAQFSFLNNGAIVSIKPNTPFIIKSTSGTGSALRNQGYLSNESDSVYIEGSFINFAAGDTTVGVGNARFYVTQDWINNAVFIGGQSTVFLTNANQLIRGSVPTPFHNLTLQGTGVKTMQQHASVSGILTLNDRELATDTLTMTVLNTDSAAITRSTGFVSSTPGGTLERAMNDTTEDYYYPLGSAAGTPRYRPLVLRPSDTSFTIVGARLANVDASLEGYDRNNRSSDICGINEHYYHHIERTQGISPVSITMCYVPSEDGLFSQISHWQNEPQWELAGFSTETVDSPFTTLTLPDFDDFSHSPFALMVPATILDSTLTVINNVTCNDGNNGSICVGFPPIAGTAPFHYIWSTGDTTNCILGLTAGTYSLSVVDSFQCPNVYTFEVTEPNPIVVTLDIDSVSCKGFSDGAVCASATGDAPPFTYEWVFGTDSCQTGLVIGTYAVTVTDTVGCSEVAIATISEPEVLVATALGVNATCFEAGDGQTSVDITGGTSPFSYLWSTPDSAETETLSGLVPDTYTVTITDINGCTATSDVNVNQPDLLVVTAADDTTTFVGYSVTLYVENVTGGNGGETYQWTPDEDVSNPQSASTAATPGEDTPFVITVTDALGCVATDTLFVNVDENLYMFPDGFVPNGQNNIFLPVTSNTVTVLKLEIFNRWGQLVGNDPTGWDGKYKGELQPMDTYVYQSVLLLPDGTEKAERGDFILIW